MFPTSVGELMLVDCGMLPFYRFLIERSRTDLRITVSPIT